MAATRLYLDWNATAPLHPAARDAMLHALDLYGNPNSVHGEGRATRAAIEGARRQVASLTGAEPAHVIFTSGATESRQHGTDAEFRMGRTPLAIGHLFISAIRASRPAGRRPFSEGRDQRNSGDVEWRCRSCCTGNDAFGA